jgi:GGDEF domain-containing protein
MSVGELVVWAGMSGAIALLCLVAVADSLAQRTLTAAHSLSFVLMMGVAAIMLTGLPEHLFPALSYSVLMPVLVVIGPLSGASAFSYLRDWLGVGRDEPPTHWTLFTGSALLIVISVALALVNSLADSQWGLRLSAAVNFGAVVLALMVCVRGALLGDPLARWMVFACALLGLAIVGLFAKALAVPGLGLWTWLATAVSTVGYFLVIVFLTIRRNREVSNLRRLALGLVVKDFDIPMPQGSQLIPKVAEAIWRSRRLERPCVVAALAVRNLYELGDELGHGVEAQILAVLAARIRRHVGFRNVVGLYHPRCFVMAVSPGQDPRRGVLLEETLLRSVRARVRVGPPDHQFDFWPSVGMGVVELEHSVKRAEPDALTAINRAEHMALEDQWMSDMMSQPLDFDTLPGTL